jgi:hypothetical protein
MSMQAGDGIVAARHSATPVLCGPQIKIFESATAEAVNSLFEAFQRLDPAGTAGLEVDNITKATVRKAKGWQEFLGAHCHVSPYVFQVRTGSGISRKWAFGML